MQDLSSACFLHLEYTVTLRTCAAGGQAGPTLSDMQLPPGPGRSFPKALPS